MRQIAEALRERGLRVCLDEWELVPGQRWIRALESYLKRSRSIAVCFGQHGLGRWEQPEMEGALVESVRRGAPVIPVALPGAPASLKLPLFLETYTWMDLRAGLTPDRLDLFVRGIQQKKPRARKKTPPKQPPGPRLHNLPLLSIGDLLKGRDEDLQSLAASLQARHAAAIVQPQAIHGLGGIGKTRLAIEYAWRSGEDRYNAVLLVHADSPEILRASLAALAVPSLLNLRVSGRQEEEIVRAVFVWLQEHGGWLLILENVDTEEAQRSVLDILPSLAGGNGHVLITSRRADWPGDVEERPIEELSPEAAAQFLLHRTKKKRGLSSDDSNRVAELAELLDGLPLALEQAAAYINHRRISFSDYLEDWQRKREKVLGWYDANLMRYPAPVAITWQSTFDQLCLTSRSILRLSAYLAPDPIPFDMFEKGEEILKKANALFWAETGEYIETKPIDEAIEDLAAYSMSSIHRRTFTVHRVVQEVLRTRIPKEWRQDWIELSLRIVHGFAPPEPDDISSWPVWDILRPHASEIISQADNAGIPEPTGRVMHHLGRLFHAKALYVEAEPLLRRALAINQDTLGEQHPEFAQRLYSLAVLLKNTNRLEEAEPMMYRTFAMGIGTLGEEHPEVATRLNSLAVLFQKMGRHEEAEPLMRRALAVDQKAFPENHPIIARDLTDLAQLLQETKRLQEAEPMIRQALAISEKANGVDHPDVALILTNLALLLQATDRLVDAEPLMRRALEIDQAVFGEKHTNVAIGLLNLAMLLQATTRLLDAEPLMRRALEIFERSLGPDHPSTGIARGNLEILLQQIAEQGKPPKPGTSGA